MRLSYCLECDAIVIYVRKFNLSSVHQFCYESNHNFTTLFEFTMFKQSKKIMINFHNSYHEIIHTLTCIDMSVVLICSFVTLMLMFILAEITFISTTIIRKTGPIFTVFYRWTYCKKDIFQF